MAGTHACVHALQKAHTAILGITPVMVSHNGFDGLSSFIGVIEGDRADIVVKDVSLNNTMHEGPTDETEFSIDRRSGTTSVRPSGRGVVR